MAEGRIRLTVLGGYLGAGKTTWLRHQLHAAPSPPHVIVNEAAELPVDDLLLQGAGGLTVLAGGCACCTGRAGLVAALRAICDARVKPPQIVLETSGLADPGAIVAAIRDDPVLVHHLLVDRVIVLADALHALAQLAADPLGRAQIAAADEIILTKVDRAAPGTLGPLQMTLAELNPGAKVSAAVAGVAVALALPPPGTVAAPLPALGDALPPVTAERLALPAELDWAVLGLWLSALLQAHGDALVRVKGVVRSPAGRLLLQAVRREVQAPEVLPEGPATAQDNTLVFIGRGPGAAVLARSLAHYASLA
jgi:G3E family GTPase